MGAMTDDNIYSVEKIVASRVHRNKKQYLIKWEGFDSSENTWEFARDILCKELIDEFEKNKRRKTSKDSSKSTSKKVSEVETKDKDAPVKRESLNTRFSNEWHDDCDFIESVYKDDKKKALMCEIMFKSGKKLAVEVKEVHDKCPVKLLEYYEKNINFMDDE